MIRRNRMERMYVVVQTLEPQVLTTLAEAIRSSEVRSVFKYWDNRGTNIPAIFITTDNGTVFIVPVAIYGTLINKEHITKLPTYSNIEDKGIAPQEFKRVQFKLNKNYNTISYKYSF
jgi:hypothetical protein